MVNTNKVSKNPKLDSMMNVHSSRCHYGDRIYYFKEQFVQSPVSILQPDKVFLTENFSEVFRVMEPDY